MATQVKIRPARAPAKRSAESTRLSPEQLVEVLELLKGATSVELKLMVPDSQRPVIRRLGFDPVEAEPRQVFFFDTPDLQLEKAGLIVRARRSPGGKADTVIKLRPIDPAAINAELRHDDAFKIEVDVMPGGYVCSGSARGRCSAQDVLDAADGKVPLESIFSRNQREFYAAHAPAGLSMDELVPLGPTFLLRLRHQPKRFDRPVIVEQWLYPDGSRVLEMSTKGEPEEAFQLGVEFRAFITSCGIALGDQAVTKTRTALAYFSKTLEPKPERRD
jgi:hypothetical protein